MAMMSCRQITEAAGDFIERRLRISRRLHVMAHLAMCGGCRAYVTQIRLTLLGLRSLPHPAGPAPSNELIEHFRALGHHPSS